MPDNAAPRSTSRPSHAATGRRPRPSLRPEARPEATPRQQRLEDDHSQGHRDHDCIRSRQRACRRRRNHAAIYWAVGEPPLLSAAERGRGLEGRRAGHGSHGDFELQALNPEPLERPGAAGAFGCRDRYRGRGARKGQGRTSGGHARRSPRLGVSRSMTNRAARSRVAGEDPRSRRISATVLRASGRSSDNDCVGAEIRLRPALPLGGSFGSHSPGKIAVVERRVQHDAGNSQGLVKLGGPRRGVRSP
jgi:hypothetical protein